MNQYTPVRKTEYDNLNRTVSEDEYNELIDYALSLGIPYLTALSANASINIYT